MMMRVMLVKKMYIHLVQSVGAVASYYLSPFVHKREVLDIEYGLRKEGNKFFIGNSDVNSGCK
jgi:hypothetical protein